MTPAERIALLEEENRQLRALLAPPVPLPNWLGLGLTSTERACVAALMARSGPCNAEYLSRRIGLTLNRDIDAGCAAVIICRVRAKLPDRRWIANEYGLGWLLTDAGRAGLRT